jgi:hypothetical protein
MISRGRPKNSENNLLQCHFVDHESHFKSPETEPGLRGEKPASSHLTYDTAMS